jgi:outer membrane protein TolC
MLCVSLFCPIVCSAQATVQSLSIADAVRLASENHPAIRESRAQTQAADAEVDVARTAYLPRLDAILQENRATHNNVFGLSFPQAVVPPISGPVLGTTSMDSVWGSAAGVLLTWEVIDFGLRHASVQAAQAQTTVAKARSELTDLDVGAAAADAFLTVLAADEAVRAASSNVDRLQVFDGAVRTLVANQLRPGADESRADAELALAKNQLSQAAQTAALARVVLAETIGAAGTRVEPVIGRLSATPNLTVSGGDPVDHPAVRVQFAAVDEAQAREGILARSWAPHISFQSAFAGRGTGAEVPGQPSPGSGAWLQVPNWGVGATISFPVLDWFGVNARKKVQAANESVERARYDRVLQNVTSQQARARALLASAQEIAQNTPVEVRAAQESESRARARYDSGLASITEVAEAQRLLAQAEADDAIARLGLWRALLAITQSQGSLKPFLDQVR